MRGQPRANTAIARGVSKARSVGEAPAPPALVSQLSRQRPLPSSIMQAMKYLCMTCLRDEFLRRTVLKTIKTCSYCGVHGPAIELQIAANGCLEALTTHFETTHNDLSVVVFERSPGGSDLRETLQRLNVVADEAFEDLADATLAAWRRYVQRYPEDEADSEDPWFRLRSDLHHRVGYEWEEMERSLHHEARFLNRRALRLLQQVFHNLHESRTDDGGPVVIQAGPGCAVDRLVRARVFQTEGGLEEALQHPAKFLGTPPPGIGQAGRMNAKGQPAFYGATTEAIALAEVRPPVGAYVATAAFHIIRPVKLLDLAALAKVQIDKGQSLLDPASYLLAQTRDFLKTLSRRMVQPVMPEQQERDYLITQVVADFLADYEGGAIDGILFPSVQVGNRDDASGLNVVLFPRAARVESADVQFKASVQVWEYEDDGPGHWLSPVLELPPPPPPEGASELLDRLLDQPKPDWPPTLRIEMEEIRVHEVRGVEVRTTSRDVEVRQGVRRFAPSGARYE